MKYLFVLSMFFISINAVAFKNMCIRMTQSQKNKFIENNKKSPYPMTYIENNCGDYYCCCPSERTCVC